MGAVTAEATPGECPWHQTSIVRSGSARRGWFSTKYLRTLGEQLGIKHAARARYFCSATRVLCRELQLPRLKASVILSLLCTTMATGCSGSIENGSHSGWSSASQRELTAAFPNNTAFRRCLPNTFNKVSGTYRAILNDHGLNVIISGRPYLAFFSEKSAQKIQLPQPGQQVIRNLFLTGWASSKPGCSGMQDYIILINSFMLKDD